MNSLPKAGTRQFGTYGATEDTMVGERPKEPDPFFAQAVVIGLR